MATSCNQMYPGVELMWFLTETLPSPHIPNLSHFDSLPPWKSFSLGYRKARHLASWHPLSGAVLCWQFSTHTWLCLTLNFCFCCSLCWGCPFLSHLHSQPPTHWLDAVCATEPNMGIQGRLPGGGAPHHPVSAHFTQPSRSTLFSCMSPPTGLLSRLETPADKCLFPPRLNMATSS